MGSWKICLQSASIYASKTVQKIHVQAASTLILDVDSTLKFSALSRVNIPLLKWSKIDEATLQMVFVLPFCVYSSYADPYVSMVKDYKVRPSCYCIPLIGLPTDNRRGGKKTSMTRDRRIRSCQPVTMETRRSVYPKKDCFLVTTVWIVAPVFYFGNIATIKKR